MNKRILVSVMIFCFLIGFTEEKNIRSPNTQIDLTNNLQDMLNKEYETYKSKYTAFPGGFAFQVLSKKGDYFIHKGFGENITNTVHFRAASNTKTFTAAGILLLHQKGLLNIKHKITAIIPGRSEPYIPATPGYDIPYKADITIWQLLTHRAGVFDVTNDDIPTSVTADVPYKGKNYLDYKKAINPNHTFTFDELIEVVATCSLSYFKPGEGYHYSNQGYSLLGKIIERISVKSYSQFIIDEFVTPMGLTSTTLPDQGDDQTLPAPALKSFIIEPEKTLDLTKYNLSGHVAEGNLISTPKDLSKFIRMLLKGETSLNLSTINNIMMDCRPTSSVGAGGYGAGLEYHNNLGYGHNGAREAYLSYMICDPTIDFTIVIFTNCWNVLEGEKSFFELAHLLVQLCRQVKAIILYN